MTDIVLLDGGMGQELVRRSPDPITSMWGGEVMDKHPHLVGQLHEDFIRAGAKVITLNAYSLTRPRMALKECEDRFELLQMRAGDLAVEAVDTLGADVSIAGSLPPLVGSYHPDTVLPVEEAARHFEEILNIQVDFADFVIAETMSSIMEAQGALAGAARVGAPIWCAFTADDEDGTRLRSGEALAEAIDAVKESPGLQAILVNCTRPEAVDQAMPVLAKCGLPFGAYANGFTHIPDDYVPGSTVGKLGTRKDLTPDAYTQFALGWVGAGATIVGGCCEVGPAHIAHMAQALEGAGHTLVKSL